MSEGDDQPDVFITDVVGHGPETGAVVSNTRIRARDLTEQHVGQFVGCYDSDVEVNYSAKILKVKHFAEGNVPGVSVWIRHSALPDGRPSRDERTHVPFDYEFELIDMMAW
ncbi:hypothetical protein [Mycolicibacterium tusciae]|uniref:hypothetical protein n=1 Tax=Mycolicibacterium tusciae TaxID=75922 RepID=UPI00024A233C|nr:hypothetical protein [Mycolicibacterium tusciae]